LFSIWSPVTSLYEYDPVADRWMARKPMPTPRGALAVAALAGKLHAVGGYNRDGNTSAHEVYDPATDSWTVLAPMPTARDHHPAAPLNRRFYAIGGRLYLRDERRAPARRVVQQRQRGVHSLSLAPSSYWTDLIRYRHRNDHMPIHAEYGEAHRPPRRRGYQSFLGPRGCLGCGRA